MFVLCRLLALMGCLIPGCRMDPSRTGDADRLADEARWRNRLIVLSAPSSDDADLREQRGRLESVHTQLLERHLLVIELVPDAGVFGSSAINDSDVKTLRARWKIPPHEFQAALVGKDGRVKDRWNDPFNPDDMHALIDTMPMRQQEMRTDDE